MKTFTKYSRNCGKCGIIIIIIGIIINGIIIIIIIIIQCTINLSFSVYDPVAVTDLTYTVSISDPAVNPTSKCILHIRFC